MFAKRIMVFVIMMFALPLSAQAQVYNKIDELQNDFYTNLQTCNPGDFQSKYTYAWHIYGMNKGKCSIENNTLYYDLKCELPEIIAKRYGLDGLGLYNKEPDKALKKYFIRKINSDKGYCKVESKQNY